MQQYQSSYEVQKIGYIHIETLWADLLITGFCCCCCWPLYDPLLLLELLFELSDVAADDEKWSAMSSYRRLATVSEMMPGTGPSSCMALRNVSMAEGLCLPSNEIPLMFTWWGENYIVL